jgi:hypothetical protein
MEWRTQANDRMYRETQAERRREAAKALHHELGASERQEDSRRKEAEVLKTSLVMAEGIVMYQRMRKLTQRNDPEATAIGRWYERMRDETKVARSHRRALHTIAAEIREINVWANKSALDSRRHGMRTDMEQQYRNEVASQAMRYQRKVMTGYVTYLPSESWRRHLTYMRAAGKHLARTEFTGDSERMLSSPLKEMKANEMWEKKAEEMMQQNLIPSSRKMNKIRKKMGGSFEIHCMGTSD